MHIHVRFFATLKDRAGREITDLTLPDAATVRQLLTALAEAFPALEASLGSALVAVNQEYAFPDDVLSDGDEVALFPPVSGGSGVSGPEYFAVTSEQLDIDEIAARITLPATGALAVFSGVVRGLTHTTDDRVTTDHLFYEAYTPMAEKMLRQVAAEIRQQYPKVQGIAIVQRIGRLEVGETTILVACSSAHRDDGIFEAARYGINRVKEIVPVWKKEIGADSSFWVEGHYRPTPADRSQTARSGNGFSVGCPHCDERYAFDTDRYLCECGEPLSVVDAPSFDPALINERTQSMWRYARLLVPEDIVPINLGEGWTSLVEIESQPHALFLKMEGLNPTGSFKDRGAALLVSLLKAQGISKVHDDSSGNAGAALAAYTARGSLQARLFVPDYASPVKLAQIELYGAQVERISGPRSAATAASHEAAGAGESYYASHVLHPLSTWAYTTVAFELWEQLGQQTPDAVVVPVGQGTLLLGLARGFTELRAAGMISSLPRLFGVQARQCAPLWTSLNSPDDLATEGETLAEGIRIIQPARRVEVIAAIQDSGGEILAVAEEEILEGFLQLAGIGVAAEPTSAVVWPAYQQIKSRLTGGASVVLCITGSGLKTPHLESLLQRVSAKRVSP